MAKQKGSKDIPKELYIELEQFANGERSAEDVQRSLQKFFEYRRQKDYEHLLFTTYRVSKNKDVKEQARNAYCDEKGIPQSFRW